MLALRSTLEWACASWHSAGKYCSIVSRILRRLLPVAAIALAFSACRFGREPVGRGAGEGSSSGNGGEGAASAGETGTGASLISGGASSDGGAGADHAGPTSASGRGSSSGSAGKGGSAGSAGSAGGSGGTAGSGGVVDLIVTTAADEADSGATPAVLDKRVSQCAKQSPSRTSMPDASDPR